MMERVFTKRLTVPFSQWQFVIDVLLLYNYIYT